jgi:hypothetical protein
MAWERKFWIAVLVVVVLRSVGFLDLSLEEFYDPVTNLQGTVVFLEIGNYAMAIGALGGWVSFR